MFLYLEVGMHVYMHACMYVCMHVYIHICMCVMSIGPKSFANVILKCMLSVAVLSFTMNIGP